MQDRESVATLNPAATTSLFFNLCSGVLCLPALVRPCWVLAFRCYTMILVLIPFLSTTGLRRLWVDSKQLPIKEEMCCPSQDVH